MDNESDLPKRCYTISVSVGADDWSEAVRELRRVTEHVEEHGPVCNQTSGGPVSGSHVRVEHRPEMAHDAYFEAIATWMRRERAATAEPALAKLERGT